MILPSPTIVREKNDICQFDEMMNKRIYLTGFRDKSPIHGEDED